MTTTSGSSSPRSPARPRPVAGLADDLEVVVQLEEVAHAAPDHRVVVDEQDADPVAGSTALTTRIRLVGRRWPGPPTAAARPGRRALEDDRGGQDRQAAGDLDRRERLVEQPAASATPTTGSNSIRIPARVPPIEPDPGQEQDRRDGRREEPGEHEERAGSTGRADGQRQRARRPRSPSATTMLQTATVTPDDAIACSAGTLR